MIPLQLPTAGPSCKFILLSVFNFYGDISTIIMCSSVIHIVCVT